MHVAGLAGVIMWTSEDRWPAMAAFYRDTLGLVPRSARPGFISFAWGDIRLTVTTHSDVAGPNRDPLRIMVNLAVDDIHSTHRVFTQRGVAFVRTPDQEPWGGWIATFHDPDGNTLQLLQPATD